MRLTLRTMLAYLDDMLEPSDAEDIGRKVEESEFASTVVHRVRDVTRRMRLEAPRLRGRQMGVDPNTVAEYLDNTLSPERVPEFEKLCLESDMHLAEVASCHQILTLVLGEPAEIDPHLRQQIYELSLRKPPAAENEQEYIVAPAETIAPRPIVERARPEVPGYLRDTHERTFAWWQMAAVAVLIMMIGATVWMAARPSSAPTVAIGSSSTPSLAAGAAPEPPRDTTLAPDASGELSGEVSPGPASNLAEGVRSGSPAPSDATSTGGDRGDPDVADGVSGGRASPEPLAQPDDSLPLPPEPDHANDEAPPAPNALDQSLELRPTPENSTQFVTPAAAAAEPGDEIMPQSGDLEATPGAERDNPADASPEAAEAGAPGDLAERLSAPRAGLGRFVTGHQVLLRKPAGSTDWHRAAAQQVIYAADDLLCPAAFRGTLSLGAGVSVELLGGTQVRLESADGSGPPTVVVTFGRVVLLNVGAAGASLNLVLGDVAGRLTFVDAESAVAFEVHAERAPGSNPEQEVSLWQAECFATSGSLMWQPEQAAAQRIDAPAHRRIALSGCEALAVPQAFPDWISAEQLKPIEEKAADALEQALAEDAPVVLRLKELVQQRKEEVRALALRSLALLGQYNLVVEALGDSRQHSYWPEQFAALSAAVARSPESAAAVRAALEETKGLDSADELYRQLWGYSAEQLAGVEGGKLVRNLDHDDQVFRVLAFCNLERQTGRTLSYRPEDSQAKRRPHVLRWRQLYDSGKLVPSEKPGDPAS